MRGPRIGCAGPFQFIEEQGYFYGRGTSDMKVMDAIWIDTLLRFHAEKFRPKRTIKLALTCGEESGARMKRCAVAGRAPA